MTSEHNVNAVTKSYCRKHGPHFMVPDDTEWECHCTLCENRNTLESKCYDKNCSLCIKCSACDEIQVNEALKPTEAELAKAVSWDSFKVQDIPENLF